MKKEKTKNAEKLPFQITDAIWDRIRPFLADYPKVHVGNPEKCRLFLSAIIWMAKKETTWSTLPDKYGNWKSISQRFRHWCNAGVFESLQTHFQTDIEISNILNALYTSALYARTLKTRIKKSLKSQGFKVIGNQISLPDDLDKPKIRDLHSQAVCHKIEERKKGLVKHEPVLLKQFAFGEDIVPDKINPKLVEVHSGSEEELLFRYACLHWSIPISSGYGRRLRFLVIDEHTDKLMGLFGLGDPVFSLGHRDRWIGWNKEDRNERLHHVVDAFVLGAVPPYSFLIGGKLIALLTTSNEVREIFKEKYEGRKSVIRERENAGEIALVTTTSALGRSSLYNRLKYKERLAFEAIGHTQGFGEFHFSNGIYKALTCYAKSNAEATASHEFWGTGFRNRQEVVQKTLANLGLPKSWLKHGIKREIYVAPLAKNSCAFLRGDVQDLDYYNQPVSELFNWFREEWLLPRSKQHQRYKQWKPQELELWGDSHTRSSTVNVNINQQNNLAIPQQKPKHLNNKKKIVNNEIERAALISKAIDRRQMLENAFENHELSEYLTYQEFIDVCISKRKVSTTIWRSCAVSNEAIRSYSDYLKGIRIAVAVFDTLIKGIEYGSGGAVWIRELLAELKSKTSAKSANEKDNEGGKSNE